MLPIALAAAVGLSAAPARADDTRSRWIAALPFGVGQLQNGDVALGVVFAVSEIAFAGTSIASLAVVDRLSSASPYTGGQSRVSIPALNQSLSTWTTVNQVTFAGWAAFAAAGVIQAEVGFRPQRAAPGDKACPSVSATASATPGGGMLGVRATF
jgi:hypothetical protein